MEKDKRRKKVDDTKPDAEDVIDELLEGVDLKQGAPEEADSKFLNWIILGQLTSVPQKSLPSPVVIQYCDW